MKTIQAMVNPRLLTKANRLFTGSLQGRIIEVLQNARRAGATQVDISSQDGYVTVRDNGRGIDDFAKLLDLGGSGWEDSLELSEDPAGVGLFCLAPRAVTIRSKGKRLTIADNGWTGAPVEIEDDIASIEGTELRFPDEPWDSAEVDSSAVFTGMQVTVDGTLCPQLAFVADQATAHPELGCRIEVRETGALDEWHLACRHGSHWRENALVNFHGQVVPFDFRLVAEHHLHFLIDLTGEPTGIRLMLPARTCLVENEAFVQLNAAMELEAFRYLQKRGHHRLPYRDYLRARELGVTLPEAVPSFRVGLLSGDSPEPVPVIKPDGFPLSGCYRFNPDPSLGNETDETNAHLLAALGTFKEPFVPVTIGREDEGYSWAKLPTIDRVELQAGKVLREFWLGSGRIVCLDHIEITAHTSDGRSRHSPVCMAVRLAADEEKVPWGEPDLLVTPQAQDRLEVSQIWHHLGGYCDDGDTYDTQLFAFGEELDRFWALLTGPDELLRRELMAAVAGVKPKWRTVTLSPDGTVRILFKRGKEKVVRPPAR